MASLEEGDDSNFKNKTNGISVRRINTDNIIKGGGFGECKIIRILKHKYWSVDQRELTSND